MKDLQVIGSSQEDLKAFPDDARRDAGFQLHFVQMGMLPADWKSMKTVGANAMEIRIHRNGEWRIIYVAKFRNAVCVLHAFEKKTQKTRQSDIALARRRYREVESRESKCEKSNEVKP